MIIVYDTETTGLTLHPFAPLHKQPRIIEFACAILDSDTGEIVETAEMLMNPGVKLDQEITKITGLTDDDLVGAPKFSECVPMLTRLFKSCDTVMAHNLPFDKALLFYDLARIEHENFPFPAREICTVGLYKAEWGRNPKLKELYQFVLGKPLAQTHRALDDVKALVEIIQAERLYEI